MSMFSCEMCDEIPCGCGWDYMWWTPERLHRHATLLLRLADLLRANPITSESSREDRKRVHRAIMEGHTE